MLKLKKIAITGGVASGKTSVCQFFKGLGACVVSADAIVHELLRSDTDLGQQLIRQFGHDIAKNGQIDRRVLAEKAFKDPQALKKLESLVHPMVFRKIDELYKIACEEDRYSSFVVEIPLLFEAGADPWYDVIVTVLSDPAKARERFTQLGFQQTEYDLRMKRQMSPETKAAKSNFTIQNNGSLVDLQDQVIRLNQIIHNP